MTVGDLLKLAESNIEKNGEFSVKVGQAQKAMYKELKSYDHKDEEDVYKALERHPKVTLNNYILKFQ